MRSRALAPVAALALLVATPPAASPQVTAPLFTGRYLLTLTVSPACPAQARTVSVLLQLTEAAVTGGSEVDGHPLPSDEAEWTRTILYHQRSSLHGPISTWGGRTDRYPVTTTNGLYLLPWLMLDGTVTTSSGRPQARGSAIGVIQVGYPDDDYPNTLADCSAANHTWALDPQ